MYVKIFYVFTTLIFLLLPSCSQSDPPFLIQNTPSNSSESEPVRSSSYSSLNNSSSSSIPYNPVNPHSSSSSSEPYTPPIIHSSSSSSSMPHSSSSSSSSSTPPPPVDANIKVSKFMIEAGCTENLCDSEIGCQFFCPIYAVENIILKLYISSETNSTLCTSSINTNKSRKFTVIRTNESTTHSTLIHEVVHITFCGGEYENKEVTASINMNKINTPPTIPPYTELPGIKNLIESRGCQQKSCISSLDTGDICYYWCGNASTVKNGLGCTQDGTSFCDTYNNYAGGYSYNLVTSYNGGHIYSSYDVLTLEFCGLDSNKRYQCLQSGGDQSF